MFDAFHAIGDQVGCSEATVKKVFRGKRVCRRIEKRMSAFFGFDVSDGFMYAKIGEAVGLSGRSVRKAFSGDAVSYRTANMLSSKLKLPVEVFRIIIDARMCERRR